MLVDGESIQISDQAEKKETLIEFWAEMQTQTEINRELRKGKSKAKATIIEEEMEEIYFSGVGKRRYRERNTRERDRERDLEERAKHGAVSRF